MATGDIRIDALLESVQASLALQHRPGTGAEITYSFLSSPSVSYQIYGFQTFSQDQRSAIRSMLDEISSQIGVNFREVDQGGVLQYGMYSGREGIPSSIVSKAESKTDAGGSVVWLNSTFTQFQNLISGEGRQIALHETGHALGLKHPGQYSEFDTGPYLPAELSTANHTIMAYNGGNTEHLGDLDLLALRFLYGASNNKIDLNVINVTSQSAVGSYFNDLFVLDTKGVTNPVNVSGGMGTDALQINVSSKSAALQADHKQLTFSNADWNSSVVALDSVERINFTDVSLAFDIEGNAGQAYRLYKAAFDRTPDRSGLGYWIKELDNGAHLQDVANSFISSTEFLSLYGASPNNLQIATSLYQHVLGRTPDQAGLNYWVDQLDKGLISKSGALASFSESSENHIAVSGQIQAGIEYLAYS